MMFNKNTKSIVVSGMILTILLSTTLGSTSRHTAMATFRPKFPNTDEGNTCAAYFDSIQDIRKRSESQGGVLSKEDQASLDNMVEIYNNHCRNVYGGNPRVTGGGAGVSQEGGQTLDTGKKSTNNDFSKAKGLIAGLNNASRSIGNMTGQNNTGMLNVSSPIGNMTGQISSSSIGMVNLTRSNGNISGQNNTNIGS